jgi:hypothetical protein
LLIARSGKHTGAGGTRTRMGVNPHPYAPLRFLTCGGYGYGGSTGAGAVRVIAGGFPRTRTAPVPVSPVTCNLII